MSALIIATSDNRWVKISDVDHDLARLDISGDPPVVTHVTRRGDIHNVPLRAVIAARIIGRPVERGETVYTGMDRRDLRRECITVKETNERTRERT